MKGAIKLEVVAMPMVTTADVLQLNDVSAVQLRNAGTATVNLFDGRYTLDSKETLSFNVTEMDGVLDFVQVPVTFDTTTGAVKKLQVIIMRKHPNVVC